MFRHWRRRRSSMIRVPLSDMLSTDGKPVWKDKLEDTVLCLFMEGLPGVVNPDLQCYNDAAWHLWYEPDGEAGDMTQACEKHFSCARAWRPVKHFHQFGAACNTPDSYWIQDVGRCLTLEVALGLGFIWYVDAEGNRIERPTQA